MTPARESEARTVLSVISSSGGDIFGAIYLSQKKNPDDKDPTNRHHIIEQRRPPSIYLEEVQGESKQKADQPNADYENVPNQNDKQTSLR